eukprot:SAG31_NODE_7164_length_1770_cov_1.464671_1_plen_145_part_01
MLTSGDGAVNRGFAGEGLYLQAKKVYEGYLVLKSAGPINLTVSLTPFGGGEPLATANIAYSGGNWSQINFELTPSETTDCVGLKATEAHAQGISCPINNTYVNLEQKDWGRDSVRVVTFSFLCPLLEKYGTFIARCNALIEKVSS